MAFLYRLISPSGKQYIGITAQKIGYRWRTHRAMAKFGNKGYLQAAIRKYGFDAFKKEILAVVGDYEYLKELEQKAIIAYETKAPAGYNMTDGGQGVLGVVVTEEGRRKRSDGQKLAYSNPARRRKQVETANSPELIKLRSEQMKARWRNPEYVSKHSEYMKNAWATEPHRLEAVRKSGQKRRKNDGLSNSQRYRLKDVDAYRKLKREYAQTPEEKEKRRRYMEKWLAVNRDENNRRVRERKLNKIKETLHAG